MDAIVARDGLVVREPTPDSQKIAEALSMAEHWRNECEQDRRLRAVAEQSEQTYRRLQAGSDAKCTELQQRLDAVAAAAGSGLSDMPTEQSAHGRSSLGAGGGIAELPANVLPLDPRGNGSAVVNGDLHERYPFLGYVDPIA